MKLHEIILTEAPTTKGAFKALFIVGPPGSGKSSIRKAINLPPETKFIDYDFHQGRQAKQFGYSERNVEDQTKMNKSVKGFIEDDVVDSINHCNPLLIDTVGNNETTMLRRIQTLQRVGYDVSVIVVDVSEQTSLDRAKSREEIEGRHVPVDYIKDVHANKAFAYGRIQSAIPDTVIVNNDSSNSHVALKEAAKIADAFYNSPIQNTNGKKLQQEMKNSKFETIAPSIIPVVDFFRILAASWYHR